MKIERLVLGRIEENCYFITCGGETAVVDPGYPCAALAGLTEKYGGTIKYILLTHRHADHLMGLAYLKQATGAQVVIHRLDEGGTRDPGISLAGDIIGEEQTPVVTDIIVEDGAALSLGNDEIRVLHTPGHTAGSVCYIIGDKVFSGDTLFAGGVGRTDLPTGEYGAIINSVNRLAALKGDYTVYPGHGAETTLSVERVSNPYFGRNYDTFDY